MVRLWSKWNFHTLPIRMQNDTASWESSLAAKCTPPLDSVIPLLGIYQEKLKRVSIQTLVDRSLVCSSPERERPSVGAWINEGSIAIHRTAAEQWKGALLHTCRRVQQHEWFLRIIRSSEINQPKKIFFTKGKEVASSYRHASGM